MVEHELSKRSKKYVIDVLRLIRSLPQDLAARAITSQIVRSSMSVGANHRAAHRAKSDADMVNKLKIVEEELDETRYWLEILVELGYVNQADTQVLMSETDQLLTIFVRSIKTIRGRSSRAA